MVLNDWPCLTPIMSNTQNDFLAFGQDFGLRYTRNDLFESIFLL